MESTIVSIVCAGIIIIAVVTMTMTGFQSASTLSDSWKDMEQLASEIRRTDITSFPPDNYGGGAFDVIVINDGQTDLSDFSSWDVIAQYQDGGSSYIDYTPNSSPSGNEWCVEGIYQSDNTTDEVFNPNILNPGEHLKVRMDLDPDISEGQTGRITISTPTGITAQCQVTRPVP